MNRHFRFRPGTHRITVTRADCLTADHQDIPVSEMQWELYKARKRQDAGREWLLREVAVRRFARVLEEARL